MARAILKQTGAMVVLKEENSERWLKLDHILARSSFDPREACILKAKSNPSRFMGEAAKKKEGKNWLIV